MQHFKWNWMLLFVGVGVGSVVALFLAPRSGQQTRKLIAKKAEEGRDFIASRGREFRGQAEEILEKSKDLVNKQRERLAEALEAGKEAAKSTLSIV